jgi:hypothetical protein
MEFKISIEMNPKVLTCRHGCGHHPHELPILEQHHNLHIIIKLDFECYIYLIFEGRHAKQVGFDILNYLLFINIISHTWKGNQILYLHENQVLELIPQIKPLSSTWFWIKVCYKIVHCRILQKLIQQLFPL